MTTPIMPGATSPALPADLRTAAPARQDAFRAAAQFEAVLVQQLAETMLPKGEDGGPGAGGAYANLLPQAMADGLAAAGGLGLARPLMDAVAPEVTP